MGKIFPLKEKPSCFEATIKLIERSFSYQKEHSFKNDFAPLIDESNFKNCFIMLNENEEVIAHIGAKDRFLTIGNEKFPITMLGGIAVDEKYRGQGYFQELLQDVLAEKRSDTSLFLLWSDNEKLYNKFGFHLCGTQFEIENEKKETTFGKTKYHLLSEKEQKEIQHLYKTSFAKTYITLERSELDWSLVAKTTSADLYINKMNGTISDYFFMNKGQDLPGIIYEYGSINETSQLISTISHFGKVWMGNPIGDTESLQYQFFMSPGDLRLFTNLISSITNNLFTVRNINLMKQEVFFDYNEETLVLSVEEFLRGVFGPGSFEELELKPLFVSGLESI
jgi:predicted N-acetyltransferase YhbS